MDFLADFWWSSAQLSRSQETLRKPSKLRLIQMRLHAAFPFENEALCEALNQIPLHCSDRRSDGRRSV